MTAALLRLLVPVGAIVVFVYALVDAIRVPDDSMYRAGNKLIWVLVILLAPFYVGPLVYLFFGAPVVQRPRRFRDRPPPDDII